MPSTRQAHGESAWEQKTKQALLCLVCDSDGLSLPSLVLEGDRAGMAASESQFEAVAQVIHYLLISKVSQCLQNGGKSKLCDWQLHSDSWKEIVPVTMLKPGYSDSCHNFFSVLYPHRVTHIRLNMYPGNIHTQCQIT